MCIGEGGGGVATRGLFSAEVPRRERLLVLAVSIFTQLGNGKREEVRGERKALPPRLGVAPAGMNHTPTSYDRTLATTDAIDR